MSDVVIDKDGNPIRYMDYVMQPIKDIHERGVVDRVAVQSDYIKAIEETLRRWK